MLHVCTGSAAFKGKVREGDKSRPCGNVEGKLSTTAELCQNSSSLTRGETERKRQRERETVRGLGITSQIDIP